MLLDQAIPTPRGKLRLTEARSVWRRFWPYLRPHRGALALAGVAAVIATMTQLASPWAIKVIFDHILSDNMQGSWLAGVLDRAASTPAGALGYVAGAIIVLALVDGACSYQREVLLASTGQKIIGKLRQNLFQHLQKLGPAELGRHRTGDLLTRLTGDTLMLRQMLTGTVVTLGESTLLMAAMAGAMVWIHPGLALLALTTVPATLWASWRVSRRIRSATRRQREKESIVATIAHDVLSSMPVIQAFNREHIERERFGKFNRATVRAGVQTTRLEAKLYRFVALAGAAGMCAVLYFGVRAVLAGSMTAGDLLVFIAYFRGINKPMRKLSSVAAQIAKSTACGRRVAELLDVVPSVRDRGSAAELPPLRGGIVFENVSFAYEGGTPALRNVSFEIHPGERIAVVGPSGAGKSTLARLVMRFYDPDSGRILIDGHRIRNATLSSLRRQIGWVQQETVLFGLTVAENIALGREDATPQMIENVARRVRAHEFIESLPRGYDTVLGERGDTLSGGQRQRLALARALLRDPAVLLLDEPATGLDADTRRAVTDAWMSPDHHATTLVICHRFHEMRRFDRVMYFEKGELVASGTHDELLSTCEAYARGYAIECPEDVAGGVREEASW